MLLCVRSNNKNFGLDILVLRLLIYPTLTSKNFQELLNISRKLLAKNIDKCVFVFVILLMYSMTSIIFSRTGFKLFCFNSKLVTTSANFG